MLRKLLHSRVPTPVILILIGLFSLAFLFFRHTTLNYNISLPSVPEPNHIALAYGEQSGLSDPDFFGKVKQQFIDNQANLIEADLSAMTLRVYKNGHLALETPISSKGREGSWWETPAGVYKVISKEKAHFSGMGQVWMPWSMNFQGNFYIHGETYYPDGTPTSKEFTGGCIRLTTENAKKVYDLVEAGTPVLVFEHSFSPDNFSYQKAIGPTLATQAYLSADLANNHVFANASSTQVLPIASITKLMTALIATEYINLDSVATVPAEAIIYTSKPRLQTGGQYSVYQLLFPLLMESSNEAAETIARFYGRAGFIKHMNEKAAAIGMLHTTFVDPAGASPQNVSTTEDLFMLAKYIYNNRGFIFKITANKLTGSAYGPSGFADLANFNDFVDNEFFLGGKNGKTIAANETNLSIFELPIGNTKRPIVFIVLGSLNEKADSQALIDYTLNHLR